ncbi:hypothetical protein C922_00333 [Plasmodium inui San Antonio 1]|uniref:Nuclear nucleic acid-binding protein C1D n=1 Tax=Plasmodium inui San Antonio 1 TaxID=1237626 RepID=W7ACN0_9APIC|nr:hypothetical protein C922_00333 [Plasmodium inui San Antonio 1]EUD69470.1 hypothetical protein C922_00333 [Plasmodium inui San Antonio 1]
MDQKKNDNSPGYKKDGTLEIEKDDHLEILKNLNSTIKEFQKNFGLLNKHYSIKDLESMLNPVQYAEYNSFLAYSICSIFHSYLKISGNFLTNHPIKNELKKVQLLMKEIKEKEQENNQDKRSLTINKEASKRIIDSCISYNKDLKKRKHFK